MTFVCVFKQKTAYELRISDWSSDVCSSDLSTIFMGASLAWKRPGCPGLFDSLAVRKVDQAASACLTRGPSSSARLPIDTVSSISSGPASKRWVQRQIGRASCRERAAQSGSDPVVRVSLKNNDI